jgi:hypothetical protein
LYLLWISNIDTADNYSPSVAGGNLSRDGFQPCLVHIGKRDIAASGREFKGQRPADTAGRACDCGGGPLKWKFSQLSPAYFCRLNPLGGRISESTILRGKELG